MHNRFIQILNLAAGLITPVIFCGFLRAPRTELHLIAGGLLIILSGLYLLWTHHHSTALRNQFLASFFFGCGAACRLAGITHETYDSQFLGSYYYQISKMNYFQMLQTRFGNSNLFYTHCIFFLTRFPLPKIWVIKGVGLCFEGLLLYFVYQITFYFSKNNLKAWLAALIIYLAPSVILNASFWGQWDAAYTSLLLGFLWFHLKSEGRPYSKNGWLSLLFLSLAFAAKLQAMFIFGLLIFLIVLERFSILQLPLLGTCYGFFSGLAFLAGGSAAAALATSAYSRQINLYNNYLLFGAPNLYALTLNIIPAAHLTSVAALGLFLGVLAFFALTAFCTTVKKIGNLQILKIAFLSFITIPFFMPQMHDRYFYPADILSVLLAVLCPALWYLPILVIGASVNAYSNYLQTPSFPGWLGPIAMGAALIIVWIHFWRENSLSLENLKSPQGKSGSRIHEALVVIIVAAAIACLSIFYVQELSGPKKINDNIEVLDYRQDWGQLVFNQSINYEPLQVAHIEYTKGLGTHAKSKIHLRLNSHWKTFRGSCAIDDSGHTDIVIHCRILSQNKTVLWEDTASIKTSKPFEIKNQNFGENLFLEVTSNKFNGAHADWLDLTAD